MCKGPDVACLQDGCSCSTVDEEEWAEAEFLLNVVGSHGKLIVWEQCTGVVHKTRLKQEQQQETWEEAV